MLKYSHFYNLFLSDTRLLLKNGNRGSLKNVFRLASRRRHLTEIGMQTDEGRVFKPYSFYQLNPMVFFFQALILGPKLTHQELGFENIAKLRLILTFRQKTLFVNLWNKTLKKNYFHVSPGMLSAAMGFRKSFKKNKMIRLAVAQYVRRLFLLLRLRR